MPLQLVKSTFSNSQKEYFRMDGVRTFLDSSTIHGLAFISKSSKFGKLFWILIVIAGFIGAGIIIHQSFQLWNESPVKTTIETRPIKEMQYPKITVCPPKNTYTDLNLDIMMNKNMTIDNITRNELVNYALELEFNHFFQMAISYLNMLEDKDKYYNWYHGYTEFSPPIHEPAVGISYRVNTAATSGTISTKHFGEGFDPEKVETRCDLRITIDTQHNFTDKNNATLYFEVEKVSIEDLDPSKADIFDFFYIGYNIQKEDIVFKEFATTEKITRNVKLRRAVTQEDVIRQELTKFPGFRLTWYFSDKEVKPKTKYSNDETTKAFVRYVYYHDSILHECIKVFYLAKHGNECQKNILIK